MNVLDRGLWLPDFAAELALMGGFPFQGCPFLCGVKEHGGWVGCKNWAVRASGNRAPADDRLGGT